MRTLSLFAVALLASAHIASAWEARYSDICEIVHSGPEGDVRVTYDPFDKLYGITITTPEPWPGGTEFAIRYGETGLRIATNRHVLSEGWRALTVTDPGFGNVLHGLETARTATATLGGTDATFDLTGAPAAVAAFRACTAAPVA